MTWFKLQELIHTLCSYVVWSILHILGCFSFVCIVLYCIFVLYVVVRRNYSEVKQLYALYSCYLNHVTLTMNTFVTAFTFSVAQFSIYSVTAKVGKCNL